MSFSKRIRTSRFSLSCIFLTGYTAYTAYALYYYLTYRSTLGIVILCLIGAALAMDAVAVSMTNGMTDPRMRPAKALAIALTFAVFQFAMPVVGYYCGAVFASVVERIAPWLSFALLAFIGGKMIVDCILEMREKKRAGEGAQLPRVLDDPKVDVAIISTTYIQQTGLSPVHDSVFIEDKNSPYVNILVAREDNKNAENMKEFLQSYQSPEVAKAAETIFNGGAVPGW